LPGFEDQPFRPASQTSVRMQHLDAFARLTLPPPSIFGSLALFCIGMAHLALAQGSGAVGSTAVATPYVDRLLDGSTSDDPPDRFEFRTPDLTPGRYSRTFEFGWERRDGRVQRSEERYLGFVGRWETERYGEWVLDGAWRGLTDRDRAGRLTIFVNALPLTARVSLDGALGLVRTRPDPYASQSLRLALPGALLYGVTGLLMSATDRWTFAVGEMATPAVSRTLTATRGQGVIAHVGVQRELTPTTEVVAELSVSHAPPNAKQTTTSALRLASATRWDAADARVVSQAVLAGGGGRAIALDIDKSIDAVRLRAGAYDFGEAITWHGTLLPQNRRGAYLRSDFRNSQSAVASALEVDRTTGDGAAASSDTVAGYLAPSLRIDRTLNVNAIAARARVPASWIELRDPLGNVAN
jgi:hypothetical protein